MRISSADDRTIMTRLANQMKSVAIASSCENDVPYRKWTDWVRALAYLE